MYFVDLHKRIRLWNAGAEAITGYSRDDVFGEPCGNRWLCHVDADGHTLCSNGCPIEQAVSRETPFENDAYLQHKVGHRIPVRIKTWPLHDRQGRMVGAVEVFRSTSPAGDRNSSSRSFLTSRSSTI